MIKICIFGLLLSRFIFSEKPLIFIKNNENTRTLINSVSFHPKKNIFCITLTQHHKMMLYEIDENEQVKVIQTIQSPQDRLPFPQHALFSKDGNYLLVVDWPTCSFAIYPLLESGFYQEYPSVVIPSEFFTLGYRPHGMSFSPTGEYLAVAYGFIAAAPSMIALYRVSNVDGQELVFTLVDFLQEEYITKGVSKGISFTPDGSSLVVTLSETNSAVVLSIDIETGTIAKKPLQLLQGDKTGLSRPEDIAFSVEGNCCAISNSDQDTVSFYSFDPGLNRFSFLKPLYLLGSKKKALKFPHGLAFSADGNYFALTQFGKTKIDKKGNLSFLSKDNTEGIFIFRVNDLFHSR